MTSKPFLVIFGIFAGLLAGIVLFEAVLRLNGEYDIQSYKIDCSLGRDAAKYFVPSNDIFLGWEHNKKLNNCNSFGNYDKEYRLKKDKETFRILVLGDSITEAGGYVKGLEAMLAGSGLGKKFEVWNCGVGCYGLKQYAAYIVNRAYKFDPDMVIIGFCMNDLDDFSLVLLTEKNDISAYCFPALSKIQNIESFSVNRYLLFHSYAYRFIMFRFLGTGNPGGSCRADASSVDMLVKYLKKRNVPLVAVLIPYLKSSYDAGEKKDYLLLKEMLAGRDVKCLDLHGSFLDIDDVAWRDRKDDFIHPSAKGHRLIAEKLYEYLMHNKIYWFRD